MVAMRQISIRTEEALQFVDITEDVQREVEASGVDEGVVMLRSRHTTAALTCYGRQRRSLRPHWVAIKSSLGATQGSQQLRSNCKAGPQVGRTPWRI